MTCSIWHRVGQDCGDAVGEVEVELQFSRIERRRSDSTPEDDLDDAHEPRLEHLPPAEREQLPRQLGSTVGCAHDLIDVRDLLSDPRAISAARCCNRGSRAGCC